MNMNFFETIYHWFQSIYGRDLYDFLAGYDGSDYVARNYFIPIGVVSLLIAVIFMVVYYYVINSSKLNKWWHWLFVLLLSGVVALFVGYGWTHRLLPDVPESLVVYNSDWWLFGLANFIYVAGWFIIISFCFKWWSSGCRRTPF